jgi:alpha-amylase/alpha-mannosidase (GH57 family)
LKSIEELGFSTDSKDNQVNDKTDDLILNQQFYPSWIVVTNKHQKINLTINNYKNSK